MTIISTAAFIIFVIALSFYTWYYFKVKRPVDKEMKEEESRIKDYDKYKNEIRNF